MKAGYARVQRHHLQRLDLFRLIQLSFSCRSALIKILGDALQFSRSK